MLEAAGQFRPWAKGPTRYQLGETLLKKELERTKTRMKIYEDEWKTNGCSIMTDGWTDTKKRTILNLCVNSKSGTVFLSSKESSDESHTGDHIYQYVEGCIQQVGLENIVQVVTDNDTNNMAAAKILKTKRPTIFWTSCAAHSINLALEGIGNLQGYKETLVSARKITVFIYAHHKSLALMRKYTMKRDIVRPGVPRFASAFLTLQSLLEKGVQLRQMFMSAQWEACNHSKKKKGKEVCQLAIANKTWGVTRCLSVFEPLVKVLRMVDADWKPSMGFLYGELKRAKQQIKDALKNNNELYSDIMNIIYAKTDGRLDSCLHLAAYILNPYSYYNDSSIQHDGRANDAVVEVIETLYPDDIELQLRIVNDELPIYKEKQGKFSWVIAIKGCEVNNDRYDPASWWSNYGGEIPNLRIAAMRLLSLTTSSSGCERNWSTFEAIHTKKRNRLEANKVNNLVYIQFNGNLINKNSKRKERLSRDTLLSNESTTEAQDWILDEGLTYDFNGDATRVSRTSTRELFEDFESKSEEEEEEVDDELEYEPDGVEILERNYVHDDDFIFAEE
ncbi:uncharacterized protein [Rutidosis leptorrhynchoides]|uniref:uncharacterized protein n=1 Tax=Rutidosis leptorrhynchoides TaxID=125765 RepID=UPI003A991316